MISMKYCTILGGAGFIGGHLASHLRSKGHFVKVVDVKPKHEYFEEKEYCDQYLCCDLTDPLQVAKAIDKDVDELYQLAADMGGAEYIFTGENDANIMSHSAAININVCKESVKKNVKKVFYSSSACIYPLHNQLDALNPFCEESSAYPANPDSDYGWEKIFSERLYLAFHKNHGLDVRIARFHNIFGPKGTWKGGKEKAPAAICRKVVLSEGDVIDIFGDGQQTRSFLYIDECVEAVLKLMDSDFIGPVNIGSEEMVTINELVKIVQSFDSLSLDINNIPGPVGVRGRNSDNRLIQEKLGWKPSEPLKKGLEVTYNWIKEQIKLERPLWDAEHL